MRETEALHSTAKIRLVQHCAATSATAELMFSQRRRNEISRLQSADEQTLDHDGVQYSRFPINVARKPSLSDWSRKPWIRSTRSTYGTMKQAADIAGHVICVCGNWVVIVNTDTETFGDFSRRKQNACGFYRYFLPYPCTSAKCNQMCTILVTHIVKDCRKS